MLYRFKSKASADVIMFEVNGRQILQIIGKDPTPPGILLPNDMPAAIQALQTAVLAEETLREQERQAALEQGQSPPQSGKLIPLRTRAAPFIQLLQHSIREETEVVWGV